MATHSSVLAWRIPGMVEFGGLLSMGSHRVGHDWSDLAAAAAAKNIWMMRCWRLKASRNKWEKRQSGFPDSSVGKESACNAGDAGSIPGSGRSTRAGIGYPLQYAGLENFMGCVVHGVWKSQTWLSELHFHFQLEEVWEKMTENRKQKCHALADALNMTLKIQLRGRVEIICFQSQERSGGKFTQISWV